MPAKNIYVRLGFVIVALFAWYIGEFRLPQIDARLYASSAHGVEGLTRYLLGDYLGASRAYRRQEQALFAVVSMPSLCPGRGERGTSPLSSVMQDVHWMADMIRQP